MMVVPPGHLRALLERPRDQALIDAANELLAGHDPTQAMLSYRPDPTRSPSEFTVDPSFGAIPIGHGTRWGDGEDLQAFLNPRKSETFVVSGTIRASRGSVPEFLVEKNGEKYPIHSNPLIGSLRQDVKPCPPTCGTSQAVGDTGDVRNNLGFQTLQDTGLDGSGVALAIVDSGIYNPRIDHPLGDALKPARLFNFDPNNSWKPGRLVTQPGRHRAGHGTMCAYDALIMAPNATLLDFPMLLTRPVADHHSTSMADAALHAYLQLAVVWASGSFDALVASNSWGMFHPSLEDYPPGHLFRFIDNPNHIFHFLVRALTAAGVDIVFCGNNCGNGTNCAGDCASGTCLSKTDRMIMSANAYQEVLTIGGCDTHDQMVGYSSRGPSIPWHVSAEAGSSGIHALSGIQNGYHLRSRYGGLGGLPSGGRLRGCPAHPGEAYCSEACAPVPDTEGHRTKTGRRSSRLDAGFRVRDHRSGCRGPRAGSDPVGTMSVDRTELDRDRSS